MARSDVSTTKRNMPEFSAWVQAMQLEAQVDTETDFDPASILQAILTASTFEDAVAQQSQGLVSGKTLADVPHTIYDFQLRKSEDKYTAQNPQSIGVYAVVQAAAEDGKEFSYGVGAANVLAILWQARQFGRLPGQYVIRSKETRNGELLSLQPLKTSVKA